MNYDDIAIRTIGENKIEKILLNNEPVIYGSSNQYDELITYAIENYIIKYYSKPKSLELKQAMDKRLEILLKEFQKKTLLINYSIILSNINIVKIVYKNKHQEYKVGVDKIKNGLDEVYNKLMNDQPVSKYDKDRLMTYFSMMITFKKDKTPAQIEANKKIEAYVKKTLKNNEIPSSKLEKLFVFNYASRYVFAQEGYYNEKRNIRIVNIPSENGGFTGGYQLNSLIAMNDHPHTNPKFYNSFYQMIQCVMHETIHAIQEIKAKEDEKSVHAMEMAIQKIFAFDEYKTGENYLFNEIEEDAQKKGYWYAGVLFQGINQKISDKLLEEKLDYINNRRFQYEYITIKKNDGKLERISKEKFNVENIRKIVQNNPILIAEYPVLNNLFKKNGTPKNLDEMLSENFKSHDIIKMYEDFIIYDIRHQGLNMINMSNKTQDERYNIITKLNNILNTKVNYVLDSINEYEFRMKSDSNKNKTVFLVKQHLNDIEVLLSFLEKELSFMRQYEKNNVGNYNTYSSYQMSVRNLLNGIDKNEKNNQLGNLEETIKSRENELNSHILILKQEYIDYILEHFTIDEQNNLIYIFGKNLTLKEFVNILVLQHMDCNHYLHKNNGDIICDSKGIPVTPLEFVRNIYVESNVYLNKSSHGIK